MTNCQCGAGHHPQEELSNVIRHLCIFRHVPSLSIVVGLFVLIAVLGGV